MTRSCIPLKLDEGGRFLEIQFSYDTQEEVKLTAQLSCRIMNLEAIGENKITPPAEEDIEVSWPIITQPIAILDTDF